MLNLEFYNCPAKFNPQYNIVTRDVNIEALPKKVSIIFPYSFEVSHCLRFRFEMIHVEGIMYSYPHRISRADLLNTYNDAQDYRIVFSPGISSNNILTHLNRDMCFEGVDLVLTQELAQRIPSVKVFRLPMWCVTLFGVLPTIEEIEAKINYLQHLRNTTTFSRKKLAALVAKRDRKSYARGVKGMILDFLEDDPELLALGIESAGRFRRNTWDLHNLYQNNKHEYLRQFMFNICPESMYVNSSVTGKIAECLEAGCIPIYWGDIDDDYIYFNPKAMVFFNPSRPRPMVPQIKQILANPLAFKEQPIFMPNAASLIYNNIYLPIYRKLEKDLEISIDSIRFKNPSRSEIRPF